MIAGWGPPVITGSINHEITPMNTIVISTIKPLFLGNLAILGAPSCGKIGTSRSQKMVNFMMESHDLSLILHSQVDEHHLVWPV